jgi:flotillin
MNLEELQEQRATFVKSVQEAVGADIQNNGLELESVSLTRLDQSDIKHFNPSNFFDAHGLTTLTKITREREQERNQIVRTTEVNIAQQDLVARQTTLTIEATKREAELAQQRDIANKTAAMRAQTAQVEQTAAAERGRIPHPAGTGGRQQADRSQSVARHREDRGRSRGEAPQYRDGTRSADRRPGKRDRGRDQEQGTVRGARPSPRPRERWRLRPRKRSPPPSASKSPNATRSST